jgi:type I restriction enzyme M protein
LLLQDYLTDVTLNDLKNNTVYGSEISSTAKVAKMNMILIGDGHSNIVKQDTLKNKVENKYDIILSNIPFNLSVDETDLYYTNSKNGNIQCLEHIIHALNDKPTARAFIIVPEGILDDPNLLSIRKRLIDNDLLKGIVSLPNGIFLPYTTAKTSILCFQGYNGTKTDKIFYYKIKNDGYTLTQRRRKIYGINDLDKYFDSDDLKYIDYNDIKSDNNYSFFYFKYEKEAPQGFIKLKEIIKEVKKKNINNYETVTITNSELYGIIGGENFWGENFSSVTSKNNMNYKVVAPNQIAYSPPRVNVGSLGINLTEKPIAISPLYVVFEVINKNFLPEYVYLYLKSNKGLEYIRTRCYGTVRQTLRYDDLKEIYIPNINIEKQKEICNKAKQAKEKYKEYLRIKNELDNLVL